MDTTNDLLELALHKKKAAEWARDLDVDASAIAQAKKRKKLSALLAGSMASSLGEDPLYWTALAGLENEADSAAKRSLVEQITTAARSRSSRHHCSCNAARSTGED
ncbi:hypothetical protein [Xylophilus ampelinus]|uniref:hypothetical protein n=1 Tax=Xylophilus ampelinus TaxID=54067 RepID=UPI0011B6AD8E|nr:hypothetical protein [Xylophilus ampelinus]MCS4511903.1 hypothetical protein [Xylophilus ampelinus]